MGNDNTVSYHTRILQVPQQTFRFSLARCRVRVCEHLDGTLSLHYGRPIGSAAMTPQGPYWSARAGERRLPEESELPDGHDRSQRGRREYRNGDRLPVYCSADRRSQGILERKVPRPGAGSAEPR